MGVSGRECLLTSTNLDQLANRRPMEQIDGPCLWQSMYLAMSVSFECVSHTHTPLAGPANDKAAAVSLNLGWRPLDLRVPWAGIQRLGSSSWDRVTPRPRNLLGSGALQHPLAETTRRIKGRTDKRAALLSFQSFEGTK